MCRCAPLRRAVATRGPLASSCFVSAPRAQAVSFSETSALYAPLLSLEQARRQKGAMLALLAASNRLLSMSRHSAARGELLAHGNTGISA